VASSAVTVLQGTLVRLRPVADEDDVAALVRIRRTPEVAERWLVWDDAVATVREEIDDADVTGYAIEFEGRVVGWIQWEAEETPGYRHANVDVYVDPSVHGRGVGTDAVRTVVRHLIVDHGHHRVMIDPAADNAAAIRAYAKVGFRPVGIMRQYELGPDGTWHDNLLMDLLADELIE
jgi:aminoglycoside 6'-N-acetyltransferase